VQVSEEFLDKIFNQENGSTLSIDIEEQSITIDATGESEKFDINNYKKTCLINGYDDIDYLLNIKEDIINFEKAMKA
jgi:3-isopropylmalate/(R)-2-methylmalate dehydratase small subunit